MGSPPSDDDPRPGQGGWPPPEQEPGQYPPPGQYLPPGQYPTPTARFPQPGGPYPPGGPGGPYPPGPGGEYPPHGAGPGYGAPPPGRRSNRGLLIALVVGLVLLACIAVALVIAFTREGGETVSTGATDTSSAAPSSSPSPSPSTSEPAPSPSPSGSTARTDELLATVPVDFPDCEPTEPAGDGDVAAVTCGPSTTRPGPQTAAFYLYEDAETLDRVFAEAAADVDPMPEGEDCSTAQGVTTWEVGGVEGGEIGCIITESGLLLAWSDRAFGIEGIVTAPGSTQEELAALAAWWTTNSDFQG
jgi:hypothetical protein